MKVYVRLLNKDWLNQFYIMAVSFLKHHPENELHVLTDLEIKEIPRLVKHEYYADIEADSERLCSLAPTLFFRGSIQPVFDKTEPFKGSCFMSQQKGTKQDLVIYTKSDRAEVQGEDLRFNFSIPDFNDLGGITQAFGRMSEATVINTRLYKPWEQQRESGRMLAFGWEQYLEAIGDARDYLDDEFVAAIEANAKRHCFMSRYHKNVGGLCELLDSLNK
ncbi:hypothetical protein [Vibrio parahaemolyticus]|uniref:hypothetical protein n=1 Tax=Vibrio parahaemolyticus TaxID=670 RepID=UPI003D815C15